VAEDVFTTSAQDTCFDKGVDFSITFLDFSIISCLPTECVENIDRNIDIRNVTENDGIEESACEDMIPTYADIVRSNSRTCKMCTKKPTVPVPISQEQ
jgi:hypothetical protein